MFFYNFILKIPIKKIYLIFFYKITNFNFLFKFDKFTDFKYINYIYSSFILPISII